MSATELKTFKIETPKGIDGFFNMDAFRLTEIKNLFKHIYEYLARVGLKLEEIDGRLSGIPNLDLLNGLEKRISSLEFRADTTENNL